MLAPLLHILPLTTIRRVRRLPVSGTVYAHLNQRVTPTDVVAETKWSREHVVIDVARTLHIPVSVADGLIRCKVKDDLAAGTVIATGGGLVRMSIKTPKPGRVVAVGGGQVLLETGETDIRLRAGMPGVVVDVIPGRGVVIQNFGTLIQGVWGNGRLGNGTLVNLTEQQDDVFKASGLDVSHRGSIILGGICQDPESLQAAGELPVRGLILSSIHPSLLPLAGQMRYPIMVTDGFGALPMNSAAYKLLSTNVEREVALNAEAYDRYSGARPEVIIPLPVAQEPAAPRDVEEFAAGQTVRMRRPPSLGGIGTISSLMPGQSIMASGLRTLAAEVKLESGETVLVPLVNLEVVG